MHAGVDRDKPPPRRKMTAADHEANFLAKYGVPYQRGRGRPGAPATAAAQPLPPPGAQPQYYSATPRPPPGPPPGSAAQNAWPPVGGNPQAAQRCRDWERGGDAACKAKRATCIFKHGV